MSHTTLQIFEAVVHRMGVHSRCKFHQTERQVAEACLLLADLRAMGYFNVETEMEDTALLALAVCDLQERGYDRQSARERFAFSGQLYTQLFSLLKDVYYSSRTTPHMTEYAAAHIEAFNAYLAKARKTEPDSSVELLNWLAGGPSVKQGATK